MTDTTGSEVDTERSTIAVDLGDILIFKANTTMWCEVVVHKRISPNVWSRDCLLSTIDVHSPLTERNSWGMKPPLASFGPDVVVGVPSEAFWEVMMRLQSGPGHPDDQRGCSPAGE